MLHKLPVSYHPDNDNYAKNGYENSGAMSVVSIGEWKTKISETKHVFDIEVEDNHNYFSNNVLISNSMVSETIYNDFVNLKLPIIFVGDHGQLPPVMGGNFNLMENPDVTLEQIHRNAGPIAFFAQHLRQGCYAADWHGGKEVEIINSSNVPNHEYLFAAADQLIVAYNATRVEMNVIARRCKGHPAEQIVVGDRIMVLKNNLTAGLFNGMQGVVTHVGKRYLSFMSYGKEYNVRYAMETFHTKRPDFLNMAIDKDVTPLDYCYAITAHKSQGDQWSSVAVWEERCGGWEHRRWTYTAATRAERRLLWVVER